MNRSLLNLLLLVVTVWIVLVDHCLVGSSVGRIGAGTIMGVFLQIAALSLLGWLVNYASGSLVQRFVRVPRHRMDFATVVLPLAALLVSPHMVSFDVNTQRYGTNKIIVSAHTYRDLAVCCINPLSETHFQIPKLHHEAACLTMRSKRLPGFRCLQTGHSRPAAP